MKLREVLRQFVIFSRPHTIIGTTLSVVVLFLIAWFINDQPDFTPLLIITSLFACLGANIYIVGLNQLTDIEIDKINKPYLPLASEAFSVPTGYIIIIIGLITSIFLAFVSGYYLVLTVILSLLLGSAYSLPPFRLKRFHFWAAFCIIAVRGLIVNILIFLHFQFELNRQDSLPPAIIILTAAMFGYSLVIAWYKDIPDMEGDARFHIKTMSIRMGPKAVYLIGNLVLIVILLVLANISYFINTDLHPVVMALTHVLMAASLWYRSRKTNPNDHKDVRAFYLFIWFLFFMEYVSFALAAGLQAL